MNHRGDWQCTSSGRRAHPLSLDVSEIDPDDIAEALANKCRYTGHIRISVAQHSCAVAVGVLAMCLARGFKPTKNLIRRSAYHDGNEAYLPDLSYPLKRTARHHPDERARDAVRFFLELEESAQRTIYQALGIEDVSAEEQAIIDGVDRLTVTPEAAFFRRIPHEWKLEPVPPELRQIFTLAYLYPWSADTARRMFCEIATGDVLDTMRVVWPISSAHEVGSGI